MGVFDSFFKKEIRKINSYERNNNDLLHQELKKHQENIQKLHEYSQNLHKYAYYIEHSNAKHKKEILDYINNINKWINYLNEDNKNLKKELNEFKIYIKQRLKEDLKYYHELMEEYISYKIYEVEKERDLIIEKIKIELKKREDKNLNSEELIKKIKEDLLKEIQKDIQINNKTNNNKKELDLNNAEKELLRLLFNEGKPLTYEQIAEKLNKPVNSIRVYMNNLKIKKPIVEEFLTANGTKVFSIKNSEMVKTLFNI